MPASDVVARIREVADDPTHLYQWLEDHDLTLSSGPAAVLDAVARDLTPTTFDVANAQGGELIR